MVGFYLIIYYIYSIKIRDMRAFLILSLVLVSLASNSQLPMTVTSSDGHKVTYTAKELKSYTDSILKINPDSLQNRFIRLLNKYRVSKGLNALVVDNKSILASKYIADYNLDAVFNKKLKLSHITNVLGYETSTNHFNKFGIEKKFNASGECLFQYDMTTAFFYFKLNKMSYEQHILDSWINSPAHNQNLLRPNAIHVGFSISSLMLSNIQNSVAAVVLN